jgi:cytochrome c peroxidase
VGSGPLDTATLRECLSTPPLHTTGHLDEIQDTFRFTRTVMAGQWFVPPERMNPYLGRSNAGLDADLDALAAFIGSLRKPAPPEPPENLKQDVRRGGLIFLGAATGCVSCHPPPLYTDSGRRDPAGRFVMHDVGTGRRLDTPSLLGLARTEPYLHDGRAGTLEEVLTRHNKGDRHGRTSHLRRDDVRALAAFLRYLRPPTPLRQPGRGRTAAR